MRWPAGGRRRTAPPLPEHLVEAVLNGEAHPDLPTVYRRVARAMAAARRMGQEPAAGEDGARALFRSLLATSATAAAAARRLPLPPQLPPQRDLPTRRGLPTQRDAAGRGSGVAATTTVP